jgi:hypothetical protein
VAEDERGPVADLGLHGDDSRQALPHEGLTDAGEGVTSGGAGALAGVENGELHVARVVEQGAEPGTRDAMRRAVVALENEHALVELAVEAAVADEVEDVERVEQGALQCGQRRVVEDDELDEARVDEVLRRRLEQLTLAVHSELGHVAGARDHDEHPQRRVDDDRRRHAEGLDLTDDRRPVRQGDEASELSGVEVLPGHGLQVGCSFEIQPEAHVAPRSRGGLDIGPEGRADGAAEQGVTEALTQLSHVTDPLRDRHKTPGGHPRRADGHHEARELGGAERQ